MASVNIEYVELRRWTTHEASERSREEWKIPREQLFREARLYSPMTLYRDVLTPALAPRTLLQECIPSPTIDTSIRNIGRTTLTYMAGIRGGETW